jgi:hypothetical protein
VSDYWSETVQSLQYYLYPHLLRGAEVPSDLWRVYEDFYLANKGFHPVDPYLDGTHTSLVRFYRRETDGGECPGGCATPPRTAPCSDEAPLVRLTAIIDDVAAKLSARAESAQPLERADSPLTDEDIDEALYAAEAAWDY